MDLLFYTKYCDICLKRQKNEPLYGNLISKEKIDVHYYCLLSADIPQKGNDRQGIYGYLIKDIKSSIPSFRDNKCYLCGLKSAAVKCSANGCEKNWHYSCGRTSQCITQFIGNFESFCGEHVPTTNLVIPNNYATCNICSNIISTNHPSKSVFSPCCLDLLKEYPDKTDSELFSSAFSHLDCIQRYVVNAGYDSKCIHCNMENMSKELWQNLMRERGIFIPYRMAVWEDDEYYKQMTKNRCGAEDCPNPKDGRNVYTCYVCGCHPSHLKCAQVKRHEEYLCFKCWDQSFVEKLLPSTSRCCK